MICKTRFDFNIKVAANSDLFCLQSPSTNHKTATTSFTTGISKPTFSPSHSTAKHIKDTTCQVQWRYSNTQDILGFQVKEEIYFISD